MSLFTHTLGISSVEMLVSSSLVQMYISSKKYPTIAHEEITRPFSHSEDEEIHSGVIFYSTPHGLWRVKSR